MPEGRFGRRLGRCVLVALFGAAFAIAGVSSAYAAVTSGGGGSSSEGGYTTLDFTWGMARPGAATDDSSVPAAQLQRDFTWG